MRSYGDLLGNVEAAMATSSRGLTTSGQPTKSLNTEQQAAVSLPPAPYSVILSGAGTGKTTVLVERVAYLVGLGVPLDDILVCTFTKAAATEFQQRIQLRLSKKIDFAGTQHGLAWRFIGKHRKPLVTEAERRAWAAPYGALTDEEPEFVLMSIDRCREEGQGATHPRWGWYVEQYSHWLESQGKWDFISLLEACLNLRRPRHFAHILVDEAQDLTQLQMTWLQWIGAEGASFYFVGDDDQAIFSFRGEQSGALEFALAQPGCQTVKLESNYRCAKNIVAAANRLILHNTNRHAKRLTATRDFEGTIDLQIHDHWTNELASAVRAFQAIPPDSGVVLARSHRVLEPFVRANLPACTIHEAKGREWSFVFVAGLDTGALPSPVAESLDEERRLAYVAVTRAKNDLVLSSAAVRLWGDSERRCAPSPFLFEV